MGTAIDGEMERWRYAGRLRRLFGDRWLSWRRAYPVLILVLGVSLIGGHE